MTTTRSAASIERQVLGVRLVADRRERRLDGHRQAELTAGVLVAVEGVQHAGGDVVPGVYQLSQQPGAGPAAADHVHAPEALPRGRGEKVR